MAVNNSLARQDQSMKLSINVLQIIRMLTDVRCWMNLQVT